MKLIERVALYKRLVEDTVAELERISEQDLIGIIPNVHAIANEAKRRLATFEGTPTSIDLAAVSEYMEQQTQIDAEKTKTKAEAAQMYLDGSSLTEVGAKFDANVVTIRKWLVDQGVKIRPKGPGTSYTGIRDRERVERIRLLREEGKTMQEIGTELHITRERVRQIMVRNHMSTERVLRPEELAAVKDYIDGTESLRMVGERHGVTMWTLKRWITIAGYTLKPNEKPQKRNRSEKTLEKTAKAAELYKSGMKIKDIARELGVGNAAMVYRYLDYAQVPRDRQTIEVRRKVHVEMGGKEMPWTSDRVEALKTMWLEGKTAKEIAETLGGITRNSVIGKISRLGLQRSAQTVTPPAVDERLASYWAS